MRLVWNEEYTTHPWIYASTYKLLHVVLHSTITHLSLLVKTHIILPKKMLRKNTLILSGKLEPCSAFIHFHGNEMYMKVINKRQFVTTCILLLYIALVTWKLIGSWIRSLGRTLLPWLSSHVDDFLSFAFTSCEIYGRNLGYIVNIHQHQG